MVGFPWPVVLFVAGVLSSRRGWYWTSAICFVAAGVTGSHSEVLQTVASTLIQVIGGIWSAIVNAVSAVVH